MSIIFGTKLYNDFEFTKENREEYEKLEYDKNNNYTGSREYTAIVKNGLPNGIGFMKTDSFINPFFKGDMILY